jgi:8-oxo-dGTP diphosphatase
MTRFPRIAVRAIITDKDNRILILKRYRTKYSPGLWELPGGKVEYGETLEKALGFEIFEETSLKISTSGFFSYLDGIPKNCKLPHYITMIFTCKARGKVSIGEESSDYRWISSDELEEYEMAFRNEEVMKKYWRL